MLAVVGEENKEHQFCVMMFYWNMIFISSCPFIHAAQHEILSIRLILTYWKQSDDGVLALIQHVFGHVRNINNIQASRKA